MNTKPKPAEEWADTLNRRPLNSATSIAWIVQQIQIDATKAALMRAAEIAISKRTEEDETELQWAHNNGLTQAHDSIALAAMQLTTSDL